MIAVNGEYWGSEMLEAVSAACHTCGKPVEDVGDPPKFCSEECRVETPSGLLLELFERIGESHELLPEEHGDKHPSDRLYHSAMPDGSVSFIIEQVA